MDFHIGRTTIFSWHIMRNLTHVKTYRKNYELLVFLGNQHLVQFSPIRKVSFQHTKKDDFNTPCYIGVYAYSVIFKHFIFIFVPVLSHHIISICSLCVYSLRFFQFAIIFYEFWWYYKKFDVSISNCIRRDHENSRFQKLARNMNICWFNFDYPLIILRKYFFWIFVYKHRQFLQ